MTFKIKYMICQVCSKEKNNMIWIDRINGNVIALSTPGFSVDNCLEICMDCRIEAIKDGLLGGGIKTLMKI